MEKGVSSLLLLLLLFFTSIPFLTSSSTTIVDDQSDGVGEWQILTKHNFSSQIRLHPHLLIFVTVPWSGEFRSLTEQVTELVTAKQEHFKSLKLRFMYRNTERVLAEAIGAANEGEGMVTVLYYHNTRPFKYRGRLRAFSILSSLRPYILGDSSSLRNDMPVKALGSEQDVKFFIDSTDKAVILIEFCGWSSKLLSKYVNNGSSEETGFFSQGIRKGMEGIPTASETENQKVPENQGMEMETGKLQCGVENGFSGFPWFADYGTSNYSVQYNGSENNMSGVGLTCTAEHFQQFDSFFSMFIIIARDFFLPTERQRFGLVSNRSLLPSLGVSNPGSWMTMLYFNGCPNCSKIIKDIDGLKGALQVDGSIVMELEGDGQDHEPELPANRASIVLFVDRLSDSSEARRRSKESLDVYRELALKHKIYQKGWEYDKSSGQDKQALKVISKHPSSKFSTTAKNIKLKDKMSITIISDGKPVSLDSISMKLQNSNLHEILETLLQKNKKTKLSSLAKEVGFHLLSDDLDIRLEDPSPSQMEDHQEPLSREEGPFTDTPDNNQVPPMTNMPIVEHEEESKSTGVEEFSHDEETMRIFAEKRKQLIFPDTDKQILDDETETTGDKRVEGESSLQRDETSDQKLHFQGFEGFFLFCDGNYRLLRSLTGQTTIPSLVIIDPVSQLHYVFSENVSLSYSLMDGFLQGYLNGSLLPYQRSEYYSQQHTEPDHPPFVNINFHEVDSIPRITAHTFSELVIGMNQSSNDYAADAWNEDVLVLFSNTWCGFCQRMELVVDEVYRAMKSYMKMIKNGASDEQKIFDSGNSKSVFLQIPSVYLLDCTLNDCSLILRSMNQREVYPALMLFPAAKKNAVSYNGDMSVTNVIKFIADHGSNSQHLINEKGILWTVTEKGTRNRDLVEDSSETARKAPLTEVLLKDSTPKTEVKYLRIKSPALKSSNELASIVVVGSVLMATDKLQNAPPFDNSLILIVKSDKETGFEGLIFNKHMKWDAFQEMEKGLEFLQEAPLSFGGPIMKPDLPLVALTQRAIKPEYPEVVPGVYFVDQSATMHEIELLKSGNHSSVTHFWFFLGYSSWGWHQLFDEISVGAWNVGDDKKTYFEWHQS